MAEISRKRNQRRARHLVLLEGGAVIKHPSTGDDGVSLLADLQSGHGGVHS